LQFVQMAGHYTFSKLEGSNIEKGPDINTEEPSISKIQYRTFINGQNVGLFGKQHSESHHSAAKNLFEISV
jgi:hypothetical protein